MKFKKAYRSSVKTLRQKPTRIKTSADTGPFCDSPRTNRPGKTCRQPAGFRTDHPGIGRCFKHGGNLHKKTTKHGRYSILQYDRVKDTLGKLEAMEADVMDLVPEIHLLRSLLVDFINNYEENEAALWAWVNDPDNKVRPRKLMSLQDAGQLVESISRVVHRLYQIQSEGSISLVTFRRVTEHMGIIVAKHVKDEKVLAAISKEWNELALDAKPGGTATTDDDDTE